MTWCGVNGVVNTTDGTCITDNSYSSGDTSKAAIDIIVAVISVLASLATIIGLVLLYKWMSKKV
jgi:hypothetical protein